MTPSGRVAASALLVLMQWLGRSAAQNYTYTDEQKMNAARNLSIGYVVFEGFEPLDVFGPLEILYQSSYYYNMSLSIISETAGPVHWRSPKFPDIDPAMDFSMSHMIDGSVVATHTFATAPPLDLLIVPGGVGGTYLVDMDQRHVEDFIASRFNTTDYVASVCTGTALLARSGILDGRQATTNKMAWAWVTGFGTNVTWVPSARWVQDGKVWTSSGVTAGMDMMTAFLRHIYGDPHVVDVMTTIEYAPHTDATWDPFSEIHNVPGANMSRSLVDRVAPLQD